MLVLHLAGSHVSQEGDVVMESKVKSCLQKSADARRCNRWKLGRSLLRQNIAAPAREPGNAVVSRIHSSLATLIRMLK